MAERAITAILASAQSVSVLDARAPARYLAFPRVEPEIHTHVVAEKGATPAVVVARNHENRKPALAQLCQRGNDAKCGARHHVLPFEPELEQITADHE